MPADGGEQLATASRTVEGMIAYPLGSGPIQATNCQVLPAVGGADAERPALLAVRLRGRQEQHAILLAVDEVIGAGGDSGLAEQRQAKRPLPVMPRSVE